MTFEERERMAEREFTVMYVNKGKHDKMYDLVGFDGSIQVLADSMEEAKRIGAERIPEDCEVWDVDYTIQVMGQERYFDQDDIFGYNTYL